MPHPTLAKGVRLYEEGRWEEAAALFSECRRAAPAELAPYNYLGLIGLQRNDLPAAREAFESALKIDPENAELWNNFGLVAIKLRAWSVVEHCMRTALRLAPGQLVSEFNLARALVQQSKFAGALPLLEDARLAARYAGEAEYHFLHGTALLRLGRLPGAEAALEKTLRLRPDLVEGLNNYGVALRSDGRLAEARAAFDRAVALKPDHAEAHINLATIALLEGRFVEGWEGFESRFKSYYLLKDARGELKRPRWDGTPLPGGTLLLLAEQGLGDTIQFVRLAARAREHGRFARVIVECQPSLARLLRGAPGIDQIIIRRPPPQPDPPRPSFDAHAPLMSLPRFFCPSPEAVPAEVPYLARELLAEAPDRAPGAPLRVGVVWAGSRVHTEDFNRSCPMEAVRSLGTVGGVEIVSLQKFDGGGMETSPFPDAVSASRDFFDTAKVVAGLDLVVSVDTAVAHLAGAMGKPLWLLLPRHAEWRWLLDRETSPWYPTARLFRQAEAGDWKGLLARVARELETAARTGRGLLPEKAS